MPLLPKLRLWKAKWLGPPLGQWQIIPYVLIDGLPNAWRLTDQGLYEYRPMTDEEAADLQDIAAW